MTATHVSLMMLQYSHPTFVRSRPFNAVRPKVATTVENSHRSSPLIEPVK
jgi:hypothetical protein